MDRPTHSPRAPRSFAPRAIGLAAALAVVVSSACASASPSARAGRALLDSETSRPDSLVVRVVNRSSRRVAISRVREGRPATLGAVSAGGEGRFSIGGADAKRARMMLAATPLGDRTGVRSAPFHAQRGQVVVFLITPELVGSQVLVDWPSR